jgi:transcriptional regulator with XRE-family HTH domain
MLNFYNIYVGLCNEKGITPSRAALEIGLSKVSVSNWKSKRNYPTDANLQKIADYFGVTVEYLKGEGQEIKKDSPSSIENELSEYKDVIELFKSATPELRAAALAVLKSAPHQE